MSASTSAHIRTADVSISSPQQQQQHQQADTSSRPVNQQHRHYTQQIYLSLLRYQNLQKHIELLEQKRKKFAA